MSSEMYEGLVKLRTGDFNTMNCENHPDGSRIITLAKDGDPNLYRFRVKNLYQKNEKVLEHQVLTQETQGGGP